MKIRMLICAILLTLSTETSWGMAKKQLPPVEAVKNVDLSLYAGKWYEIARLPKIFEKNCVGVTAEYALRSDGRVDVFNTCRKKTCEGRSKRAHGIARVVDTQTRSKLKVSFFWPFEGDYWILDLHPDYRYVAVGSPDRKSFWILSRTPTLPEKVTDSLISHFEARGFDLSQLERTQPCE